MEVQQIALTGCDAAWIKDKAAIGDADVQRCGEGADRKHSRNQELSDVHIDNSTRSDFEILSTRLFEVARWNDLLSLVLMQEKRTTRQMTTSYRSKVAGSFLDHIVNTLLCRRGRRLLSWL